MTRYRIKPYSLRLNIPYLEVFATAEVYTVPVSPITNIPVTGQSGGWVSNSGKRYYRITRDGVLIRAGEGALTDDGINVFGVRNGDPGLEGREELIEIEPGDIVTAYRQRVPAIAWSRIDEFDAFLKLWQAEFDTDQPQTQYPPPQPNFGTDRVGVADPVTGLCRFTFDAFAAGRETFAYSGVTPDIEWLIPAGGTIVGGYSVTDPIIEVDFVSGQHEMRLRADDTGAAAPVSDPFQIGKRNVFVKGEDFTPFSELVSITGIQEDPHSTLGRNITFTSQCSADTDLSDYFYVGADVFLSYQIQSKTGTDAWANLSGAINCFKGFLSEYIEVSRDNRGIATYQIRVENPLQFFSRFGIASQVLQIADPPTTWMEAHPDHANLGYVIGSYLLETNAPSLCNLVDFVPGDFLNYFFPDFSFQAANITAAAQSAAQRRPFGNVGCLSDGAILAADHPWILSAAQRTALGTVRTWVKGETNGKISFTRSPLPKNNRTRGACFVYSGGITTTYIFEANLLAPGYGNENPQIPDFLAVSEAEGMQIVGNAHALANLPTQMLPVEVSGMLDMIDPALMLPHQANMAILDPLTTGMWGGKFLPTEVQRTWNLFREANGITVYDPTMEISFKGVPEAKGIDAPEFEEPALGGVEGWDWAVYISFIDSENGFNGGGVSTHVPGAGFRSEIYDGGGGAKQSLYVVSDDTLSGNVTYISFCYRLNGTSVKNSDSKAIALNVTDILDIDFDVQTNAGFYSKSWEGSEELANRTLDFSMVYLPTTDTADLRGVYIAGNGTMDSFFSTYGVAVTSIPECG